MTVHDKDVSYIRTDDDLPPVAIIDRSPITVRHKIGFGIIAVIGAIAWAVIAFARGETVNAVWFVVAAICTYIIGFRFYARLIEMKIVRPRDDHATPGRGLRRRHRLRADRPARAVRPSFRRDRRGGTTRRSGAGHPDGLPALQHLDHRRRGVRRRRAGLPGVVDLHPATGPLPGPDGPRRTRRHRRRRRTGRRLRHHGDHHRGAGAGRGAADWPRARGACSPSP